MARLAADSPFNTLRGQLGKQLVFKRYKDKVVITSYPDMSRIKPSRKQKQSRSLFKEAVAYAKRINHDAALKAKYLQKVATGESVYHYAIKEYLKNNK